MVTADVLAVTFFLAALFAAIPAFQLVVRALWPRFETQSRRRFERTPVRTLFVGALVAAPLLGPALGLLQVDNGAVRMIGVWWLATAMATSLIGLSGLASYVGGTLPGPSDEARTWWPMAKGTLALELACLIPILGWFLLFPLLLTAGAGAAVFSLLLPLRDPPADAVDTVTPLRAHA